MEKFTDEKLKKIDKAGIEIMSSLRGEKLCCQVNGNIKFIDRPIDGTFDPNRPEHLAYIRENAQRCYCKVCGAKYWAHYDLREKKFIARN